MANIYVSSGTSFSATISITYPAGSTCTVSNYKKTWTAPNTSGSWTFKANEVGYYTVKSASEDQSKEEEVFITTEGQSESVELSYTILLINNGIVQSNPFSVFNGTATTFKTVGSVFRAAITKDIAAYFDNKIDFSEINSLEIALAGGRTAYNITFGLISTKTSFSASSGSEGNKNIFTTASTTFKGNPLSAETKSIDVSKVSGSYYLGMTMVATGAFVDENYAQGGCDISKIELI